MIHPFISAPDGAETASTKKKKKKKKIANPAVKFSLSSRHITESELCERYPVTRHLLESPPNAAFPYPATPSLTYRVASQLENEKAEFTLLRSIGRNRPDL